MWWIMVITPYLNFIIIKREDSSILCVNPCHFNKEIGFTFLIKFNTYYLINYTTDNAV